MKYTPEQQIHTVLVNHFVFPVQADCFSAQLPHFSIKKVHVICKDHHAHIYTCLSSKKLHFFINSQSITMAAY